MSDDITIPSDVVARVANEHRQEHDASTGASTCSCGGWSGPFTHTTDGRSFGSHLADEAIRAQLAPTRPEPEGDDWWATTDHTPQHAAPAAVVAKEGGWDVWLDAFPDTIILRPEGSPHALGSLTPREGHDWRIGTVTPGHVPGFDWRSECECGWSMRAGTRGEIYRASELHAAGLLTKENNA